MKTLKEKLQHIQTYVSGMIDHDPNPSHSLMRVDDLLREAIKDIPEEPTEVFDPLLDEFRPADEKKVVFGSEPQRMMPGTRQFNSYVFQKVNCKRDIKNIATRYGIDEDKVIEAYNAGQDMTKV